jgi:heterodisulfide reductase subunit D
MIERLYICLTCGKCNVKCPSGIDVVEIIKAARAELVNKKAGPLPDHKLIDSLIQTEYNPFGKPAARRFEWAPEAYKTSRNAEIVYFAGCMAAYWYPEIAQATLKIFEHLGIKAAVLKGERCCGLPPLWDGQISLARDLAKSNIETFHASNTQLIVTTCAGCYRTLKTDYPKLFGKVDYRVMHITEFLSEYINENKMKFKGKIEKVVTYHDPCHLGRHMGIYEDPRAIIQNIPGLKFKEMENIKKDAECCGGGAGVFRTAFAKLALTFGKTRVEEAKSVGAEVILTSCPMCMLNLSQAARRAQIKIEVSDPILLLAKTLGS